MFLKASPDGVALAAADDFTDLHVEVDGMPEQRVTAAFAPAGELGGEHAWVDIEWLRAAGPDDGAWRREFDTMIDYARGKGWLDESGRRVRAHVVRT